MTKKYLSDSTSELERILMRELGDGPEIKKGEKLQYLGQYRERIIFALTEIQAKRGDYWEELEDALDNIRAFKMILKGNLGLKTILRYERLAGKHKIKTSTVFNPHFKGDIGLLVVSNHALDLPDKQVFPPESPPV